MSKKDFVHECLKLFDRDDVKANIKNVVTPFISPIGSHILTQIMPYIYICMLLVVVSFILHLGIFIMLARLFKKNQFNNDNLSK
jgi:hypothetical protein